MLLLPLSPKMVTQCLKAVTAVEIIEMFDGFV